MVRSVKSHHHHHNEHEEEEDDHEFASRTPEDSSSQKVKGEGRSGDKKLRSKHSETEQRRRSKINERFQILRDLIPENDQKRDKATFLLEVIQYIQFLQEKIQFYEGSYQGWSPEPSKLMPWRNNHVPVESFVEQSTLVSNGCNQEDNIAVSPTLLNNAQNSESNLTDAAVFKLMDHHHGPADPAIPINMPLQPNMYEGISVQPQGSFSDAEHLASQSQFPYVASKWITECTTPSYTSNELEDFRSDAGEASISNAYSQGLLNTLTRALQSSGVDLSQANISVQLDIGKQANPGAVAATHCSKDLQNQSMAEYATDYGNKRLRTEES